MRIADVASNAHPGDSRSDESLLGAMAIGDETAGVAFVRRYQRRVYGLAMSILQDSAAAEDVAQEALMRVWRHSAVYDARRASVATWVLTITRNLAIDAIRIRRSMPLDPHDFVALSLESSPSPGLAGSGSDPAEVAERRDLTQSVKSALTGLPLSQRRALVLSAFYGLSAKEISEMESVPLGTVKTRIRTGLMRVKDSLGVSPPAPRRSPSSAGPASLERIGR
ncbi:MAG: RNA polymerase sigma factor [Acidimicrobiales bacterium]